MKPGKDVVAAVKRSLSHARLSTYERAAAPAHSSGSTALSLYAWNAEVSGALLSDLHVCEVVIRNAISEILEILYGEAWPWSQTFEFSLPDYPNSYSPRKDLLAARRYARTPGKVIPELKMVFWQRLLTRRYDDRLWNMHLVQAFPHMDSSSTVAVHRAALHGDIDSLRELRNRIAHHEPIFTRNLVRDQATIHKLIGYRCLLTVQWLLTYERSSQIIAERPV